MRLPLLCAWAGRRRARTRVLALVANNLSHQPSPSPPLQVGPHPVPPPPARQGPGAGRRPGPGRRPARLRQVGAQPGRSQGACTCLIADSVDWNSLRVSCSPLLPPQRVCGGGAGGAARPLGAQHQPHAPGAAQGWVGTRARLLQLAWITLYGDRSCMLQELLPSGGVPPPHPHDFPINSPHAGHGGGRDYLQLDILVEVGACSCCFLLSAVLWSECWQRSNPAGECAVLLVNPPPQAAPCAGHGPPELWLRQRQLGLQGPHLPERHPQR